ncbi:MAG TPA: biliverdin-producing heme oxygenase [Microbacteriaceae bacterium]|nr:biliverdin-producing heme oxygenase [Microbacteriaceae bacterium]
MSIEVAPVLPLSTALRERTRTAHEDAETSPFIRELMEGKRSREEYIALAGQQYFIYQALEEVGAKLVDDPTVGAFIVPELARLAAIEADLDFLSPGWRDELTPLPSTLAYVERIHGLADWPAGFLAHHYTRYLGDLSGGQVIRTMLQRHYGFGAEGLEFYHFPGIPKAKVFKDEYRARLDGVVLDEVEFGRVLAEANAAFRCNEALFVELDQTVSKVA